MLNLFVVEGRMTKDVETSVAKQDLKVARFSVACQESKDVTHFINGVAFGKTAELLFKYCTKGTLVSLSGKIVQDSYTDKNGNKRSQLSFIANSVSLLSKPQSTTSTAEKVVKKYE